MGREGHLLMLVVSFQHQVLHEALQSGSEAQVRAEQAFLWLQMALKGQAARVKKLTVDSRWD